VIKLVYCITRKPGMSPAEFSDYWLRRHAPIGARIPGVRRFVQGHAIRVPGDAAAPDFDGMVELWFDDVPALLAARSSEAWKESTADEAHFVDPSSTAYFVSEEKKIL
jgi:uncharacterized protein (TIGR02118 family)